MFIYFILFYFTLLFTLNGDISALSLLPARSGSGETGPPDSWLLVPSLLRVVMAMGALAPAWVVIVLIATGHRPPQRPLAFGAVPPHLALCPVVVVVVSSKSVSRSNFPPLTLNNGGLYSPLWDNSVRGGVVMSAGLGIGGGCWPRQRRQSQSQS